MILPYSNLKNYPKIFLRICKTLDFSRIVKLSLIILLRTPTNMLIYNFANNKNGLILREIHGHSMWLNLQDKGLSQELCIYGIHEPFLTFIISNEVMEGDVVVDVGANIGYYALKECSLIKGTGKVIAIEPDPRSRSLLYLNVAKNGYSKNIDILPVAVGPQKKKGKMQLRNAYNVSSITSSVRTANLEDSFEIDIDMVPLDELVSNESKIDIIRMDIEGYEFEVIKGMTKTLLTFKPRLLLFELHPIADTKLVMSFFEVLSDLGYTIEWAIPRHLIDGLLTVPIPLLNQMLTLIVPMGKSHANSYITNEKKIPTKLFAEQFCSSKLVYHVMFKSYQKYNKKND
jgi:FkbM family methyltransferase